MDGRLDVVLPHRLDADAFHRGTHPERGAAARHGVRLGRQRGLQQLVQGLRRLVLAAGSLLPMGRPSDRPALFCFMRGGMTFTMAFCTLLVDVLSMSRCSSRGRISGTFTWSAPRCFDSAPRNTAMPRCADSPHGHHQLKWLF